MSSSAQREHVRLSVPVETQVASLVVTQELQLWPDFAIVSVSTSPQIIQIRDLVPVDTHVASFVIVQAPQLWPSGAIISVSMSSQTEHL